MKTMQTAGALGCLVMALAGGCAVGSGGAGDDSSLETTAEALSSTQYSGRASVLRAQVLGITAGVVDTGPLPAAGGTNDVKLLTANVVNLLDATALSAYTAGVNDHTISQTAASDVALGVHLGLLGDIAIGAGVVTAHATASCSNHVPTLGGGSLVTGLVINGRSIRVTGAPNQTINLVLGKVIINEQTAAKSANAGAMHVAAIHVLVAGLADVSLVAADAGIDCGAPPPPPAPTCTDGVKNGPETGVDCGGPTCNTCPAGGGCSKNADCQSNFCQSGVCATPPPTCTDGVKNGTETGVDCGGLTCGPCSTGGGCLKNSDCKSNSCQNGVCAPETPAPSCYDETKNGQETGVDCGGPSCAPCSDNQGCMTGSDCQSGSCEDNVCTSANSCVPRDYVAGQGRITTKPSAHAGFFTIYGEKANGKPIGNVIYDDDQSSEHVKSTDVTAYTITGPQSRRIQGNATVRNKAGTFTYTVDVTDNGAGTDEFSITVSDGYYGTGIAVSGDIELNVSTCL